MLEPIKVRSLAKEAFDRVVAAITSGEFEPGEKLSESHLARQLGISRGPIREALQQLEGKLVQREPRLGVRVIQFDRESLLQLFYLREALEGMAARLAAENAPKQWARDAERMLQRHTNEIRGSGSRAYHQRTLDEDFHFSIARASACTNIERLLLNEVNYQLRIARLKSSMRPGRADEALRQHYEIFEAICDRDPDRAERAMRHHISSARESIMAMVAATPATPAEVMPSSSPDRLTATLRPVARRSAAAE
jgi:DNA-binding GntR family transcriptional regulator